MSDWHDPFAKDEEDIERERRRAEREARRTQRQGSLGEKVQAEQAAQAEKATEPVTAAARRQAGLEPEAVVGDQPPEAPPPAEPGAPPVPPATPPPGRPTRGLSPDALLIRRIVGALIVLAIAALLVFGATKVIGALGDGGSDTSGPKAAPVKTSSLTIPEGLDRHQIADIAKKAKLKGDYEQASKSFKGFDPGKYGADNPPNLEGFLFPATYELPNHPTVKDLISRQLEAFKQNLAGVDLSYAKSKNLTTYDVLKIASMIEREVSAAKDRPLVSEVIYNRLKAGTPLGIDATLRYYLQNYDEQLTQSELADPNDPYNTRIHTGLPPTPIGNPGLASIEAAANPAKGDLFYFVVKPDTCGETFFTASEAEFEQAQAEYQAALQAQGGAPTQC
jgi:cell division protein YceG involved in septum cleavage